MVQSVPRSKQAVPELSKHSATVCTANTPCRQNAQVLNDETGGMLSYHWHQSLAVVTKHRLTHTATATAAHCLPKQ
jgi:hypothetical protein